MANKPGELGRAELILKPWLEYEAEYDGQRFPVGYWIHSKYCKVPAGVAMMRLTAGWPINMALREELRKPIIWKHDPIKTSKFLGVAKRDKRWCVVVKPWGWGTQHIVAACDDECFAAAIYNIAARRLHGKAAKVNLM